MDAWYGYAIALLVGLIGWLAGLNAASRGAERGAKLALGNALRLEDERRHAHERDLRTALAAEIRLNAVTLERAQHGELLAHIRTAAWDASVVLPFTEREWEALVDAYSKLGALRLRSRSPRASGTRRRTRKDDEPPECDEAGEGRQHLPGLCPRGARGTQLGSTGLCGSKVPPVSEESALHVTYASQAPSAAARSWPFRRSAS